MPNLRVQTSVQAALLESYVGALYHQYRYLEGDPDISNGQALDKLSLWLRPLMLALAQWTLDVMQSERSLPQTMSSGGDDLDLKPASTAVGAAQRLNEYVTGRLGCQIPSYCSERCGEQSWKVTCTVRDRRGIAVR